MSQPPMRFEIQGVTTQLIPVLGSSYLDGVRFSSVLENDTTRQEVLYSHVGKCRNEKCQGEVFMYHGTSI